MNRETYGMMSDALKKLSAVLFFSDTDDGIRQFAAEINADPDKLLEAMRAGQAALAAERGVR